MGKVNWRRVLVMASLIFSLVLLCGSIYLHLRQKHRLGRLHFDHDHLNENAGEVEVPEMAEMPERAEMVMEDYDVVIKEAADSSSTTTQQPAENVTDGKWHLSEDCLACISHTVSGGSPARCNAGLFCISRPYWIDAGQPGVDGVQDDNKESKYKRCINDNNCAQRAVTSYMKRYVKDCNQDNIVDCRDYIHLHLFGPSGCTKGLTSPIFMNRMLDCFKESPTLYYLFLDY